MTASMSEFADEVPEREFVSIPVDLGREPDTYMRTIKDATKELPVSIVVNNAGYLVMGFFHERGMDVHAANIECNALAAVRISHHFYSLMVENGRRGCITFTSSSALFMVSCHTQQARTRLRQLSLTPASSRAARSLRKHVRRDEGVSVAFRHLARD